VTHVIGQTDMLAAALTYVHDALFAVSPLAVGAAKRLIDRNFASAIEVALEREALAQASLYKAGDVKIGYRAFKNKSRPNFGDAKAVAESE